MTMAVERRGLDELFAELDEIRFTANRTPARALGLELVGRNQRRAVIAREVHAFGIDEHRHVQLTRLGDHALQQHVRQRALAIITEDERVESRQMPGQKLQHLLRGGRARRIDALVVHAQHLMGLGDEARLERGRPLRVHHYALDVDTAFVEQAAELVPSFVFTDETEHGRAAAGAHDVGRDVAGTAEAMADVAATEHEHRRLGRHALGVAIDVAVEDQIAEDEHARRAELIEQVEDGFHESCGSQLSSSAMSA
jgi:hypothetical protein